ncbi:MAG: hypothetical protein ACM3XO_28360, partial [Bacteroidota bacterium]
IWFDERYPGFEESQLKRWIDLLDNSLSSDVPLFPAQFPFLRMPAGSAFCRRARKRREKRLVNPRY